MYFSSESVTCPSSCLFSLMFKILLKCAACQLYNVWNDFLKFGFFFFFTTESIILSINLIKSGIIFLWNLIIINYNKGGIRIKDQKVCSRIQRFSKYLLKWKIIKWKYLSFYSISHKGRGWAVGLVVWGFLNLIA